MGVAKDELVDMIINVLLRIGSDTIKESMVKNLALMCRPMCYLYTRLHGCYICYNRIARATTET
jgi:hypothetical protein